MAKALVLFSGGLDSILAAKLLQSQEIETICVHFTSPFFGQPELGEHWRKTHGLDVMTRDVSDSFVEMLLKGPEYGFGKNLNPCVDCKILLFSEAKKMLSELGADFLASGEVIGQRPMSQRRDTLNLIQNKAGVSGLVVRPLSGKLLDQTIPEKRGQVSAEAFKSVSGRGRTEQLALAEFFQLKEIPSPAGGCLLTEKENTRRYWQLLQGGRRNIPELLDDFRIIGNGRALFHAASGNWLVIGRNRDDNRAIGSVATTEDALISVPEFPSPLCLARRGSHWPSQLLRQAAEIAASYSPAAVKAGRLVNARIICGSNTKFIPVSPARNETAWQVPTWEETHGQLKEYRKTWLQEKMAARSERRK